MKKLINYLLPQHRDAAPLTEAEKKELRGEFWQFMDAHPLPERSPLPSLSWQAAMRSFAPHMAMILLFIGVGSTAYMAEDTEPGEFLYAVKRSMNEEVMRGVTAFSPKLRAQVDTTLLSRRLLEAESLILRKDLTGENSAMLRTDIDEHTNSIYAYIAEADASGEDAYAEQASDKLEVLLDAHNTVLLLLDSPDEALAPDLTEAFIKDIEKKRSHLQTLRLEIETQVRTEAEKEHETTVRMLTEEFKETADELAEKSESANSIDPRINKEIQNLITTSTAARESAEESLAQGQTVEAIEHLENALEDMAKADVIVTTFLELHD